ncbi:hypothetical protein [Neorhizobium galegae]|uniref:hypothetical protein n=1 Tax=Neorhizobium galegae TaxID=399 RepID=UPI001F3EA114|nr:hypothetical protein [Neorhizobium galegae]UIK06551.1 hypothetical protein LZK81_06105 [Neorhizobium galegae]
MVAPSKKTHSEISPIRINILRFSIRTKVITLLIVLLSAASAPAGPDQVQKDKQCDLLGDIAEHAMKSRQKRMLLADALKAHQRAASTDFAKILDRLTLRAYAVPAFLTPELQQRAIAEFRDMTLFECVKADDGTLVQQDDLDRIDNLVGEKGRSAFIHEAVTKLLDATEHQVEADRNTK